MARGGYKEYRLKCYISSIFKQTLNIKDIVHVSLITDFFAYNTAVH